MLTSMKLGLATTVAALSIAVVTSAGAAVNPTHRPMKTLAKRWRGRNGGLRMPNPPSAGSPPTTMTTALSAIGIPARAQTRALHLHPRAPLLRCRLKRVANVRKILVTAAPVSSGAAANSQPDCLKAAGSKAGPPFRCRIAQKHDTKPHRVPVSSDTAIAMEGAPYGSKRGKCADRF